MKTLLRVLVFALIGVGMSLLVLEFCFWAFIIGEVEWPIRVAFMKAMAIFGSIYGAAVGWFMIPSYKRILDRD